MYLKAANGHTAVRQRQVFKIVKIMKYSLRKGSVLLYFQMKDGISNDIFGSNLQIEYSDESNVIEINIDLSGNLRTRNKPTLI